MTNSNLEKCQCAYCKEGKSGTIEEYFQKVAEVSKSLRESLRNVDWKPMFRKMYGIKE